ncbi:hypothetical protein B0H21DRAFT_826223 [Amylocystis lapponica]|nr:hypothetical protein B0H21DRAFT_826223 [Amylocystis lapponica]
MAEITYGPVAAVAARPVAPASRRKAPQLSTEQRKAMAAKSQAKQADLQADILSWYEDTTKYSKTLAEKYGKKPEFYLHLMFSGGVKLQSKRKPNAFNAWSRRLAQEANEGAAVGSATSLLELQKENIEEYHNLAEAEKAELIAELEEQRASRSQGLRLNTRGRKQDIDNVCKKIECMLFGLKCRVGIEAFYCVVRSTPEFDMIPRWFFTTPQIDNYLRGAVRKGWNPEHIGTLTEAFSVAGCDFMTYLSTSKMKADWMKGEIRDKINTMLVNITGKKKAQMNYVNYEKEIVLKYGVELHGWTHEKFANPSNLSTSVSPLRILLDAIEQGECRFVRLTATERAAKEKDYDRRAAAGEVPKRKKRKDAGGKHVSQGKKRARPERGDDSSSSSDDDNEPDGERPNKRARPGKRKAVKSAATVPTDDEDNGADAGAGSVGSNDISTAGKDVDNVTAVATE